MTRSRNDIRSGTYVSRPLPFKRSPASSQRSRWTTPWRPHCSGKVHSSPDGRLRAALTGSRAPGHLALDARSAGSDGTVER
jgi:hypothetical protein